MRAGLKRVEKKVENKGLCYKKLTKVEQEVLSMLVDEYSTPKRVAIRRGTTDKAVYKTITQLKKKGVLNSTYRKVEKTGTTIQPFSTSPQIRLHGQEFNIRILFKDQRYSEIMGKANMINIDGNTVRLYKNSIEVYSGHSFYADDVQKVTSRSFEYFNRLFARLENDLKIIIVKSRYQNIKLVNQHYAETNNELAGECERRGDKIRVYTTAEGKLWFTIDNSFNLHEAETQHSTTAKADMQDVVRPHFNDLRDNKPPLPSEVWAILSELTRHEKEIGAGLNSIVQLLKPKDDKVEGVVGKVPEYIG